MLLQLMSRGTIGVLRPYLDDTILFLVTQFRDPYSAVKVEALGIVARLALHSYLEQVSRRCAGAYVEILNSSPVSKALLT